MNRLVYIAVVSDRIPKGQYFTRTEYHERRDCIYERMGNARLERRSDAKFHA
jgi:hypothetical protein